MKVVIDEHVGRVRLLPTFPHLPVTHGDRQGGELSGREARRDVVSTENRGFRSLKKRRKPPPSLVLVQLKAGRQGQGPKQGELPASLTGSL
jgi:hypothetical protein